jgi:hypothetical protein
MPVNTTPLNPDSNTGLKCQDSNLSTKVDFLQLTFEFYSRQQYLEVLDDWAWLLNDEWAHDLERECYHGMKFDGSSRSARGAVAAANWTSETEGKIGTGWLSLPSGAIGDCDQSLLLAKISDFAWRYSGKVTRLDIALDDFDRSVGRAEISDAVEKGNYAGTKIASLISPKNRVKSESQRGWCWYFGSPSSNKRVRVYDKNIESKGELNCIRWEAQFRDEVARKVMEGISEVLVSAPDEVAQYLSSVVVSALNFVERIAGKRLSRLSPLPWWTAFCDGLGKRVSLSVGAVKPVLARKVRWIGTQWQSTLAIIRELLNDTDYAAFWNEQLESGKKRLTASHRALIEVARMDFECMEFSSLTHVL